MKIIEEDFWDYTNDDASMKAKIEKWIHSNRYRINPQTITIKFEKDKATLTCELAPRKRYAIFAGNNYYPSQGWGDFMGWCDNLDEAKAHGECESPRGCDGWWEVVDTEDGEIHREDVRFRP